MALPAWDYSCGHAQLADLLRAGLSSCCWLEASLSLHRALGFLMCLKTQEEEALQGCENGSHKDFWKPRLWSHTVSLQLHSTGQSKSQGQPRSKRERKQAPPDERSSKSHCKRHTRWEMLQPSLEIICHIWFQTSSFFPSFLFIKLIITKHLLWANPSSRCQGCTHEWDTWDPYPGRT